MSRHCEEHLSAAAAAAVSPVAAAAKIGWVFARATPTHSHRGGEAGSSRTTLARETPPCAVRQVEVPSLRCHSRLATSHVPVYVCLVHPHTKQAAALPLNSDKKSLNS